MQMDRTTLFFSPSGLMLSYREGVLYVDDLNPEAHIAFRMTPKELLALGWRCICAALRDWSLK